MAESKHTQDGPWEDAGLTGNNPRITGGPLRLIKSAGVVIAFLPAWLDDEAEEARANARLIASAPELLKALEALVDSSAEGGLFPDDYAKELRVARTAIAKAQGTK